MPVIVIGTSGAQWGLSRESGIIVQRSTFKTQVEENHSKNKDGEVQMLSFYNPTQTIQVSGISLGAGLANAIVGTAITLANAFTSNGVGSGGIYLRDIEHSLVNTEFSGVSLNAGRWPLV